MTNSSYGDPIVRLHHVNTVPDGSLFVWGCWYSSILGQATYYMGYTKDFPTLDDFKNHWSDRVEGFWSSLYHYEPQFELDTIRRRCGYLVERRISEAYLWYPEFEKFTKVLISKL